MAFVERRRPKPALSLLSNPQLEALGLLAARLHHMPCSPEISTTALPGSYGIKRVIRGGSLGRGTAFVGNADAEVGTTIGLT